MQFCEDLTTTKAAVRTTEKWRPWESKEGRQPPNLSATSRFARTTVGIYPERMKILVAKGTIAPRAAYEPVAARIIEVDSGGVTGVNPARFAYKHIRPNLFGVK